MKTRVSKSIVSVIVVLAVVLSSMAISGEKVAAYGEVYDSASGLYYKNYEEGVGLVDYVPKAGFNGNLVIPSEIQGRPVVAVMYRCFYLNTRIKSVKLPNGLLYIGQEAFALATSLKTINIPSSVTWLGTSAFQSCTSLSSITIPASVETIYPDVFAFCKNLKTVTIKSGVKSISQEMFWECTSLTKVSIPGSVATIGAGAFGTCSNLQSVIIASGVKKINEAAFISCTKLKSISLPSTVTSIGSSTFTECKNLTSVTLPAKIKQIPEYAFSFCSNLTNITIPASVTSIGQYAFAICPKLSTVTFLGKVKTFGLRSLGRLEKDAAITFVVPSKTTSYYAGKFTADVVAWGNYSISEAPATPALTAKRASASSIKLTWKKVTGATGYEIYRATSASGTYKLIKSLSGVAYTNTKLSKGQTRYYKVRAYKTVNGKKVYSAYSTVKSATP